MSFKSSSESVDRRNLYLSIVVPAYNEEMRIGKTLKEILSYLSTHNYTYELIIVDDGSTDETIRVVNDATREREDVNILTNGHNCGKGFAVKKGMLRASGQYILFTDADLSTPVGELGKFLEQLESGFDLVIGSRKTHGAIVEVHQTWVREYMGRVFTWLTNIIVTKNLTDITCGFKCFRLEAAKRIFSRQRLNDWSFDAEILFIAQKLGYIIKEVPVSWRNDPHTKVHLLRDTFNSFLGLLKIRLNNWRGRYD